MVESRNRLKTRRANLQSRMRRRRERDQQRSAQAGSGLFE
jgi:hypothetical protein